VAFFDLDKTIIAKAAMPAFRGPLRKGGLLSRRNLWRTAFAQLFYLHLRMSETTSARMRTSALKLIKGWERARVLEIVDEALERIIDPIIFAEAVDLIELHHAEGRQVVIVSASPDEIVTPLGRYLGADETIASSATLDEEGRYTGEIAFYAYGEAKAEAIRQFCSTRVWTFLRRTPTATHSPTFRCSSQSVIPLSSTPIATSNASRENEAGRCATFSGRSDYVMCASRSATTGSCF